MGNSIYAIQLTLESCILGMIVLVFFFVGGRCACPVFCALCMGSCGALLQKNICTAFLSFPITSVGLLLYASDVSRESISSLRSTQIIQSHWNFSAKCTPSTHFFLMQHFCPALSVPHCLCMYGIVGVVFLAFLVRFGFQVFLAYIHIGVSPLNPSCPFVPDADRCGASGFPLNCASVSSACCFSKLFSRHYFADEQQCSARRIYIWTTFTPQLETAIMIVSGPVTLLVALWAMTSARTRKV